MNFNQKRVANFKKLNAKFEERLEQFIFQVNESDLTEVKAKERITRCKDDELAFAGEYYPEIFTLPFNAAHRWVSALTTGKYTLSGFRYSGKSAFTYIAKAIKPLAQGMGGIVNINARTMDISNERTRQLLRLLKRNRKLMFDWKIEILQEKVGYYIIKGLSGKSTFLIAGSYSTGLRNLVDDDFKRIKIAINDDLYNAESVTSKIDNERVKTFIDSEVSGQLEPDGLSITMGNSISENCPIVLLKKEHPENHFSLPALDESGKSTWPEYRSEADWENFQQEIPWDVWLGEYMDQPAIKGDIMQPEWLRGVNVNLIKFIVTISACDPSRGASPAACDKAFIVGSLTDKQELVVRDLHITKESYDRFFDYCYASRERTQFKVLLWENDFGQWDLANPYYRQWQFNTNKSLPVTLFDAKSLATAYRSAEKADRILNLVHPFQTGMLQFDNQILNKKDFERFKSQFLSYGKAKENIDGLDALATLYIMIFRYIESGTFKPTKERTWQKLQRMFR